MEYCRMKERGIMRLIRSISTAIILIFIILPALNALPDLVREEPVFSDFRVDPYLRSILLDSSHDDEIRVIARFRDDPIDLDIKWAEDNGLEIVMRFTVLPMAVFDGTAIEVNSLSLYERTIWIEYDGEMELLMEESTTTINATVAWNSWISGARTIFPQATGEGVTVAVVDTGIDAGHPDLDYGTKTITNLKSDIPGGPWYELENSDTSYGHGTHCAGTIAGNGDASAGARQGVAPDSRLIGLCVGDVAITLTNTLQGLEWVYENSRPPNSDNIRVVSNSWGGGASEYDPEDATTKICQKLTFENNVLVVFAMGNSGSEQHEGNELTASPTGLIPSNIGVAASERDGSGIAYFSSRGERGKNQTYPDVSAPGVKIWSAHARATVISAMAVLNGNPNPYYLAISGTSMATPHISGLAALMYQVAPSLTISDRWEDYSGDDPGTWYSDPFNRIHEIEWIMEQSANYISPDGVPLTDTDNDNGVPEPEDIGETEVGWDGRTIDWAQGYGLVDAEKCVGISLTLERLRVTNPGKRFDVADAMEVYFGREVFIVDDLKELHTDRLHTSWRGEFARYAQNQDGPLLVQNQSRLVWVPEGATEIHITLEYTPIELRDMQYADITFNIDFGNDGTVDYEHRPLGSRTSGTKEATIEVDPSHTDMYWAVGIYGSGFKVLRPIKEWEFPELRVPYAVGVEMSLVLNTQVSLVITPPRQNSMVSSWVEGMASESYTGGVIELHGSKYDLDRVIPFEKGSWADEDEGPDLRWLFLVMAIMAAVGGGYYLLRRKGSR